MIVALDNSFLSLVFFENARPMSNPATNLPVEHWKLRIDALIDQHSSRGDTILIPTPCLAELLVVVPDFAKIVSEIDKLAAFEVAAFDVRAAVDLAEENRKSHIAGDKKDGGSASWAKIKFDRQIAIIAKVNGAEIFYTDDINQSKFVEKIGLQVKHSWDLDLPPKYAQKDMYKDGDL